jgi:hypothetical protein
MKVAWARIIALLLVSVMPAVGIAQTADRGAVRYSMPFTHMWDMQSVEGETYRIFVSYPSDAEPPEDGYPVLYVLDGNAMFAAFAEARRLQEYYDTGKAIVVGVGYPTDDAYDVRRLYDLTPPLLDPPPPRWRRLAAYKSGGREQFLFFLTGRLREEIASRYQVDGHRQSLFGHSLGGLFGLYVLYTQPEAFHSIVVASPSLEWNEQGALAEERAFATRLHNGDIARTSRLMIVVGENDVDDDPEPARALADRLDRLSGHGLRVRYARYEYEGHMGVPTRAVTDTLRFTFGIR